ncbi:hypothetical protein TRAPUB_8961 [Trametes pubescens]|uniref:Uncharacterized protein n=1 Tax=Trametes pubescens TaxID=154538 RepID=A0A1M2W3Q9_TRAPU|nr:hypothetical protein TRAPUB_8961 [Trametes pubescens]
MADQAALSDSDHTVGLRGLLSLATHCAGLESLRFERIVVLPEDVAQLPQELPNDNLRFLRVKEWVSPEGPERGLTRDSQYSVPCRIAEAEPYLREVIGYAKTKGGKTDVTPALYLAVAIHGSPEKEQEALSLFTDAFADFDANGAPALGPRSELWARAHWARLLRRLAPVPEAEAQEQVIVDWIVSHPLVLPPAKLQALVTDKNDDGPLQEILMHPEVLAALEQARE